MRKRILITLVSIIAVVGIWFGLRQSQHSGDPGISGEQSGEVQASQGVGEGGGSKGATLRSVEESMEAYAEENLSASVLTLLGLDDAEHNYNSLISAISGLSKELTNDDVAALRDMLTWPNDKFPEGMRSIEINAVKNDVLDRLLRQDTLPEGIGLQLVEMASNPENDPVWRDYCVQFMTPYYERASGEIDLTTKSTKNSETAQSEESVQSVDQLKAVREAMVAALDERDGTIAGTSLIGLELLSRTHDEFDRDAIAGKASEIAADESASPASRMTALRMSSVAGGDDSTVETARSLAQTGETVLLRSAAIVTLGETGSKDDRELLESFAASDNKQISAAARMALEKMDARNL